MVYQQVRVRIWITHTVAQETPLLMGDRQVCRVSHPLLSSDNKGFHASFLELAVTVQFKLAPLFKEIELMARLNIEQSFVEIPNQFHS